MKISGNKINTILLDMDGTLLDLHYDNHFWLSYLPELYARNNGLTSSEALHKLIPLFTQHQGSLQWYDVHFWSQTLEIDILHHKNACSEKIAFLPTAQAFLQHCQSAVSDVRLITNAHRDVYEIKNKKLHLDPFFSLVSCSHELGFAKEQALYWQKLMALQAFDKHHTVFIDDNEQVLDSAKAFGIAHLYSIQQPDTTQNNSTRKSKYPMLGSLLEIFERN